MIATPSLMVTVDVRRLAAWRRSLGLTQAQVAARAGMHAETLSRIERALMPGEALDRVVEVLQRAAEGAEVAAGQ